MQKDFLRWHLVKSKIDKAEDRPNGYEREVWFCYTGANVGYEQDGRGEDFLRPMVIVKKFNAVTYWAIPLTKRERKYPTFLPIIMNGKPPSFAILSQLKLIDGKRLRYKAGMIDIETFSDIKKRLQQLLA
jgi:mRNA interferase MazF